MELENPNLPEEILIEIFSRTTAKTVGRCRCLSKTWRTHLSTSQFVNLHLSCRTCSPESLLLLIDDLDHSLHTIDAPIVFDNTTVSRKLDFGITWNDVLGSCNGLVLLSNTKGELFLVNPITLQNFKLPPLSSSFEGFSFIFNQYGLGYDSLTDDYKVVEVISGGNIHVYSVKSGAWEMVDDSRNSLGPDITRNHGPPFVNGAIQWYCIGENTDDSDKVDYVIGVFDFAGEVFHVIPAAPFSVSFPDITLLVLEGCLCMSTQYSNDNIDIWMMKQYGLADSWTKFTIATNTELCVMSPLCSLRDMEKIVCVTDYDELVVYNLEDGTTKDMVVDGVPASFSRGVVFVDSLVSPNQQYSN